MITSWEQISSTLIHIMVCCSYFLDSCCSHTGGAISLVGSQQAVISHALFIGNEAISDSGLEVAYACGGGHGGALCLVGSPGSNILVSNSVFLNNTASYGGGMSIHADLTCTTHQLSEGCFNATVGSSCKFLNNSAFEGAGGALFWTHPGNLNISCSARHSLAVNADTTAEAAVLLSALPCDDWSGNHVTGAGYGPVAASTSLYLQPTYPELPYYTSNAVLPLQAFTKV